MGSFETDKCQSLKLKKGIKVANFDKFYIGDKTREVSLNQTLPQFSSYLAEIK